jgi:peptide/nickel transport system ATP-binding protein
MSEKLLLSIKSLSVELLRPARRSLLSDINFNMKEGETVGLVGQSGSGKSLTTLAITGLLPGSMYASGSIVLGGNEIIGANESALNKIRGKDAAIIFQEPTSALDPLMTLEKQIALPLAKHRNLKGQKLRDAVFSLMEEVKLGDNENNNDLLRIARSLPHQVSGGQRQRAAIALALSCSPRLLIADEPTSSLDAGVQKEITNLIHRVAIQRGAAVLFISHDIALVKSIASRILVMKDGRIVEDGDTKTLIENPQNEYTKLLISRVKNLQNRFQENRINSARLTGVNAYE